MTRDSLLELLHEVERRSIECYSNHDCTSCYTRDNIMPELGVAISWLETLPKGVALVGLDCEYWQAYGMDFSTTTTIDVDFVTSNIKPSTISS